MREEVVTVTVVNIRVLIATKVHTHTHALTLPASQSSSLLEHSKLHFMQKYTYLTLLSHLSYIMGIGGERSEESLLFFVSWRLEKKNI